MKDSIDVVIHINEKLNNQRQGTISSEVKKARGVISAKLRSDRPHLMIVAYNPIKTKALEVLTRVKNTGMHAQLVGWL